MNARRPVVDDCDAGSGGVVDHRERKHDGCDCHMLRTPTQH